MTRRRTRNTRLVAVGAAMLVATAFGALAPLAAAGVRPPVKRISLLYVTNAAGGSLQRLHGHLVLALTGQDRRVTWFSDRPARRSGSLPARGLATAWSGFGFAASPPNAALVYTDPASRRTRTAILVLRHPRELRGGTGVAFTVSVVDPRRVHGGDLAGHARRADASPATVLRDPSLFIDDTSAPVADGCVLQAWTYCNNINLANVNLAELNLTGAAFANVGLSQADFADANLNQVTMNNVAGDGTNFSGANLSNTVVSNARFGSPNFSNANFFSATFSVNRISGADLDGASNLDTIDGCAWPGMPFAGLAACW